MTVTMGDLVSQSFSSYAPGKRMHRFDHDTSRTTVGIDEALGESGV